MKTNEKMKLKRVKKLEANFIVMFEKKIASFQFEI